MIFLYFFMKSTIKRQGNVVTENWTSILGWSSWISLMYAYGWFTPPRARLKCFLFFKQRDTKNCDPYIVFLNFQMSRIIFFAQRKNLEFFDYKLEFCNFKTLDWPFNIFSNSRVQWNKKGAKTYITNEVYWLKLSHQITQLKLLPFLMMNCCRVFGEKDHHGNEISLPKTYVGGSEICQND